MGDIMCIVMGMEAGLDVKQICLFMIFDNQYGRHMSKNFGIIEFANIICQNHLGQVNLHIQFTGLIWGK